MLRYLCMRLTLPSDSRYLTARWIYFSAGGVFRVKISKRAILANL
jgi:hypothetical protein